MYSKGLNLARIFYFISMTSSGSDFYSLNIHYLKKCFLLLAFEFPLLTEMFSCYERNLKLVFFCAAVEGSLRMGTRERRGYGSTGFIFHPYTLGCGEVNQKKQEP